MNTGRGEKMDHELALNLNVEEITVWQGKIDFARFEELKEEALELSELIRSVVVNEETVKQSKKLLAEVNKSLKDLEDRRIAIKRLLMEPYQDFELKVKEIVGIVKEADQVVRDQVKALEEAERSEKQNVIMDLFSKRIKHYSFRDLFDFHDFFRSKHLNKSMSIDAVENEIIEFLERIARDLKAIENMPDPEAVLSHYLEVKDIAAAITLHGQAEAQKRRIEASKAIPKDESKIGYLVSIAVGDKKELALIEMFLNEHEVNYHIDKITI